MEFEIIPLLKSWTIEQDLLQAFYTCLDVIAPIFWEHVAVNFNRSSFMHLLQANYNYLKPTSPFQANVKCFKLIATINHIFKQPAPYSRISFKLTAWILKYFHFWRVEPLNRTYFNLLHMFECNSTYFLGPCGS